MNSSPDVQYGARLPMAARWLLLGSASLAISASPPLPLHLLGDLLAARAELHAAATRRWRRRTGW